MKIGIPGIAPEPTAGRTAASSDGALAELNWRRALEQAQWELRGQDRPAVERTGATHSSAPAVHRSTPATALRADTSVSADDHAALAPASQPDASSTSANAVQSGNGNVHGSGAAVSNSISVGSSLHAAKALDADGLKALVERCVQWCTRFPETKWMPVSVHVRVDGNMLGVTLRDA